MYLFHFGINELPFTLTPNTSYFYGLPTHNEALQVLYTALRAGEGFIKVTGEVGTGKTLLCRKLLNEIPEHYVTAYIPNPYLNPQELRRAVASELSVELSDRADQQEFTQRIQERLIEISKEGLSVVLIIDEAQALPVDSLEVMRLFTNLETESKKLMQVVLFGQPELNEKLSTPELRQLLQRITFSYNLSKMDKDQLFHYIKHRLIVSGYRGEDVFDRRVCELLYRATGGTPRMVNILCHKALMLAYGEGKRKVTKAHMTLAIKDTDACKQPRDFKLVWLLGSLVFVVLLASWFYLGGESLV